MVTGGASGLGEALVREAGARGAVVGVVDLDGPAARRLADEVGGVGVTADVGSEDELRGAVEAVRAQLGEVDVFVSNAGVSDRTTDPFTPDARWDLNWRVNTMPSVYAARILLPRMLERGSGHLVATASSNALTTNPVDLVYAATKHAQLAVMEWLAMTYGRRGIGVTCFCPKGMRTPMLEATAAGGNRYARQALERAVTAEQAARICLDAWVQQARELQSTVAPDTGLPPSTVTV